MVDQHILGKEYIIICFRLYLRLEENTIDGAYVPKAYRALLKIQKYPHSKAMPYSYNIEKKKN